MEAFGLWPTPALETRNAMTDSRGPPTGPAPATGRGRGAEERGSRRGKRRLRRRILRSRLRRVLVVLATAGACVGAGATAGPVAYASELFVPLVGGTFGEAVNLGLCFGGFGAVIAAAALWFVPRKHRWWAAAVAPLATWLLAFLGVLVIVVNSQD